MAMRTDLILLAATAALALAGCATDGKQALNSAGDQHFGEAFRQTLASQVIDPTPEYETAMTATGVQAAAAQDRYAKGTVKQPDRVRTTNAGNTGGGGGGN